MGESDGVEDNCNVVEDDEGSEDVGCFEGRVGNGSCCISMGPMRWSP